MMWKPTFDTFSVIFIFHMLCLVYLPAMFIFSATLVLAETSGNGSELQGSNVVVMMCDSDNGVKESWLWAEYRICVHNMVAMLFR